MKGSSKLYSLFIVWQFEKRPNRPGNGLCGWLLILPLFKAGQLVQQWVASSSLWAGAGWWAARVIERENSEPFWNESILEIFI